MRFRDFIERQIGLGDLNGRMDQIFRKKDFGNFGGAFVSSDVSGSEQPDTSSLAGHSLWLPSTDLTIPQIEKEGRIIVLSKTANPIYIKLSDGTEAYFTYDEFRRIKGKPELGRVMKIVFQRHPKDASQQHSKIDHAEII